MAEEITASSMGESIGLGYRTKDIGPQLMQFQAADLARKALERNAAKKEKKAEKDKSLERLLTYETKSLHPKVQLDASNLLAETRTQMTNLIKEQDLEGATKAYIQAAQLFNGLEKESESLTTIAKYGEDPSKLVNDDLLDYVTSTDPAKRRPTKDQIEQWNAMGGINYDEKTNIVSFKGVKTRDVIAESNAVKPTIETFKQYQVGPTVSKQPTVAGQQKGVSLIYIPNEPMWLAHKQQILNDPELVVNGVNRIAKAEKIKYGDLAIKAQNEIILKDPSRKGNITYEEVNRYILGKDLEDNHKKYWIDTHTVDEQMNPVPIRASSDKDKETPPSLTDIQVFEHLAGTDRTTIIAQVKEQRKKKGNDFLKGIENKTDKDLLAAVNDDIDGTFGNKDVLKKARKQSYGVVISSTQEDVDLPSLGDGGKQIALSSIYYDKNTDKFYATGKSTVSIAGGVAEGTAERQFELTDKDLRSINSAAVNKPGLRSAVEIYNGNAPKLEIPTITKWLDTHGPGRSRAATTTTTTTKPTKPTKITAVKFKKLYEQSKLDNPGLTEEAYATWLLKNKNTTK